MAHLLETMNRIADNDPTVQKIKKIPTGTVVLYHGRMGSMRQGRTEFPAMVLKQHEDDGSLDVIVFFEAEDMIWEQRVLPRTDTQPGHSYTVVEPVEPPEPKSTLVDKYVKQVAERVMGIVDDMRTQMYGDYEPPEKPLMDYLDDFDRRLSKLERKK